MLGSLAQPCTDISEICTDNTGRTPNSLNFAVPDSVWLILAIQSYNYFLSLMAATVKYYKLTLSFRINISQKWFFAKSWELFVIHVKILLYIKQESAHFNAYCLT